MLAFCNTWPGEFASRRLRWTVLSDECELVSVWLRFTGIMQHKLVPSDILSKNADDRSYLS